MQILDIINKKKNAQKLTDAEINYFVSNYVSGQIPDYQISALLMCICHNGMDKMETYFLTKAMLESGSIMDLSKVPGIKIDKHSTGGVGDKVSLILSPICAALGLNVAKLSGTGLGHTGGTIDKLNSIGINTNITAEQALDILERTKMFIMSQTPDIVPADMKLYALRNATATVDSIPLIVSSICSKKLALATDCIFIDIKYGDGAFCPNYASAKTLGKLMKFVFKKFGRKSMCHITDMNQPLGRAIGNAIEIRSAISFLSGQPESRELKEFIYEFVGDILTFTKAAKNNQVGKLIDDAISSGKALKAFYEWAIAQGAVLEEIKDNKMFKPVHTASVRARARGFVAYKSAKEIGEVSLLLGAGRLQKNAEVDFQAGIYLHKVQGEKVEQGGEIASLYSSAPIDETTIARFEKNYAIKKHCPKKIKLIKKVFKNKK